MWANALANKPRRYKESDYETVSGWFRNRAIVPPSRLFLPEIGFMLDGIAAGFLIQTDTSFAVIDYLVANLGLRKEVKAAAIVEIAESLIKEAEYLGYEFVKCDTQIESIAQKAMALGFKETGMFRTFLKGV